MEFRTILPLPHSSDEIDWTHKIQLYGSCFIQSIGEKMSMIKLNVDCNPFGVLYNPLSIKNNIEWLLDRRTINNEDLIFQGDRYHSFLHHSAFSSETKEELLNVVNRQAEYSRDFLLNADWLFITFGSAYVYRYNNKIVANCHKLPESLFSRERLTVTETVDEWRHLIEMLSQLRPNLRILFTVSPIRHWRDGIHNNQLSKSILLLAIDELCHQYRSCVYFPSYELVMDELRDYRFYDADMNHISPCAIDYIWERFSDSYFSQKTLDTISEWSKLQKAVVHKPINENADSYKKFNVQTLLKLTAFQKKYPYFDISNEISIIENRLL